MPVVGRGVVPSDLRKSAEEESAVRKRELLIIPPHRVKHASTLKLFSAR